MLTLHGKGVKRWLYHAEKGNVVAAGIKAEGKGSVVFGGRAETTNLTSHRSSGIRR